MIKVEIWSDIVCPFCYIGKRRFEKALEQFEHKDQVEVVWKSFQLNKDLETDLSKSLNQYLSDAKGLTLDQAQSLNQQVSEMAKGEGLTYNLNRAVVANSFNAQRLIQFAKVKGKGDEAEEALFKAYFTEGKNIDEHSTLVQLASSIGLDSTETDPVLKEGTYAKEVNAEMEEAFKIGVSGVPFFAFNRKFAISGAEPVKIFVSALERAVEEQ